MTRFDAVLPAVVLAASACAASAVEPADTVDRFVAALTNLEELTLARTAVAGAGVAHLHKLDGLWDLNLSESVQLGDAALKPIGQLRLLRRLNLWRVLIGDHGVAHFAGLGNLEWLNLADNRLTDAGLNSFAGLRRLRWLSIGSTAVSAAGIGQLADLAALRELSLQRTAVDAESVRPLQERLPGTRSSLGGDGR